MSSSCIISFSSLNQKNFDIYWKIGKRQRSKKMQISRIIILLNIWKCQKHQMKKWICDFKEGKLERKIMNVLQIYLIRRFNLLSKCHTFCGCKANEIFHRNSTSQLYYFSISVKLLVKAKAKVMKNPHEIEICAANFYVLQAKNFFIDKSNKVFRFRKLCK